MIINGLVVALKGIIRPVIDRVPVTVNYRPIRSNLPAKGNPEG